MYFEAVRVAVTHPYAWPEVRRGAERIAVETARALVARGHEVTLLTAGSRPERNQVDGFSLVRLRRLFASPYRHEQSFALRIMPHLVRGHFDAVHALMPFDALAAVLTQRLGGHVTVYEEMGIPWRSFWRGLRDRRVREYLVKSVDVYGCMSEFARQTLEDEWGRRGDLIPGGVRLSDFSPALEREPAPTILFSAVLDEPRKGLGDLLASLAILVKDEPKLQLWLSGPGDPSAIIRAAPAEARDLVIHLPLGSPHEQGERYARAWVTALPSISESFGLVLIESLATGTPIVVVDDAAPPSLVTPATGASARPHDPASLAEALRTGLALARDPQTAEACRSFALGYDWQDGIAPLLEDLYSRGRSS